MPRRFPCSGLLVLSLVLAAYLDPAWAQPSAIQYAYDELGRLQAVVDQQGNTGIYSYDAVGNMLSIHRVDAATLPGVAITALVPDKGKTGTVVSILGKGFGGAGQNAVAFNGVAASVTQAFGNRIITSVPAGATTGPVTVATPIGSAFSPRPFRIVGALTVTPVTATLGAGSTQQFVASDGGVETTNVLWSIDGLLGDDATAGTISAQGLYVAPLAIASSRTVVITATSRDDTSAVASVVVTLRPPAPAFLAAAPTGVHVADAGLRAVVAPGVGVQRALDADGITIVADAIGVVPAVREVFFVAAPVSVITSPSPPEGAHP